MMAFISPTINEMAIEPATSKRGIIKCKVRISTKGEAIPNVK
jgi:hypothetical protein